MLFQSHAGAPTALAPLRPDGLRHNHRLPLMNPSILTRSPLLELIDVTVEREATRILDRVNLTIPRGRHTAVLGPNGSGKTSLLKVLVRQFYPSVEAGGTQGEVRILGQSNWEVAVLRRRMGVVTAGLDLAFSSGRSGRMSVVQAVASGFTATELPEFGLPMTDEVRGAVDEALSRVGGKGLGDRRVETLSTGERRRVLIARALVHAPEILVLDEPTSGLDVAARSGFLQSLRTLIAPGGLTLVLVTHHVEEILPEINHVILLDRGRVSFDGPKPKALQSEPFSRLYRMPIETTLHADGFYTATVRAGNALNPQSRCES